MLTTRVLAIPQGLGELANMVSLYLGSPAQEDKVWWLWEHDMKRSLDFLNEFWHQRALFGNKSSDNIYKFPGC